MNVYFKRVILIFMLSQCLLSLHSFGIEIKVHPEEKLHLDALIKRLNIDNNKIEIWDRSLDEGKKKNTNYYKEFGDYKYFYLHEDDYVQNINFITNYDNRLVYLRIMRRDLVDLREIKHFKYLRWLDIHVTNIKSLKGIDNLVDLEKFEFNGNDNIISLSDLKNLPKLRVLLPNTSENITDISGMKNLPNLTEFDCSYCKLSGISVLSEFPMLERLEIGTTDKTLKSLERLKNLKVLHVKSDTLEDISSISKLVRLEELDLNGTKVTKFNFNNEMSNLKKISFNKLPLNKFFDLNKVPNLEELRVIRSGISELNFPRKLNNIRELRFFVNKNLNRVTGLTELPKLEVVEFTRSPINEIEIDHLPKLKQLDLSGTNITQLSDFSSFPSLRELYLRDTKVKSLESILDAPRLWLVGLDSSARDIPNVSLITQALKVNALSRKAAGDDTPTAWEKYRQLLAEQKEAVSESSDTPRRRRR